MQLGESTIGVKHLHYVLNLAVYAPASIITITDNASTVIAVTATTSFVAIIAIDDATHSKCLIRVSSICRLIDGWYCQLLHWPFIGKNVVWVKTSLFVFAVSENVELTLQRS